MTQDMDHVILTRFNLPTQGAESLIRAQESWLIERAALFESYCLPSILAQDSRNFSWIIYFDPASPQWLMEKISCWAEDGAFTAIFREQVGRDELVADIRQVTGALGRSLLTTNLDNDDGLAINFVSRLQDTCIPGQKVAIYLTNGLILEGSHLYLNQDEHNAFCSVLESWENPGTCWVDWHTRLADHMPIRRIDGAPAWVQLIHGRNVSNRVHGQRIAPEKYSAIFGDLIAGASTPQKRELLLEAYLRKPMRYSYELGRRIVKNAVLHVGGRAGLDKVKYVIQQARNIA